MQKQIETNNEQMEVQKKSLASFKEELNNFYLLEKDVKTFKEKVKGKLKNIKLQVCRLLDVLDNRTKEY